MSSFVSLLKDEVVSKGTVGQSNPCPTVRGRTRIYPLRRSWAGKHGTVTRSPTSGQRGASIRAKLPDDRPLRTSGVNHASYSRQKHARCLTTPSARGKSRRQTSTPPSAPGQKPTANVDAPFCPGAEAGIKRRRPHLPKAEAGRKHERSLLRGAKGDIKRRRPLPTTVWALCSF